MRPNLERLEDRLAPTTATLAGGLLYVHGDDGGNKIGVKAPGGVFRITERGAFVPIQGAGPINSVVIESGRANRNSLSTGATLAGTHVTLIGHGAVSVTFAPGSPATAIGSEHIFCKNTFISTGGCTFIGGAGINLFVAKGGSNRFVGAGRANGALIEAPKLTRMNLRPDAQGGAICADTYLSGIQTLILRPAPKATVTLADVNGVFLKKVQVDVGGGTVDARHQEDRTVTLVVNGKGNRVVKGFGPTVTTSTALASVAVILARLQKGQ